MAVEMNVIEASSWMRLIGYSVGFGLLVLVSPTVFWKGISPLQLVFANICGSMVYAVFYIIVLISWSYPPQTQADACGFFPAILFIYYITEIALFVDRLKMFYPMDTSMQKRLDRAGKCFQYGMYTASITDLLLMRPNGVIFWNNESHGSFCFTSTTAVTLLIEPISASGGFYLLYVGIRTVLDYLRSATASSSSKSDTAGSSDSSKKADKVRVLVLMLTSFGFSMFSGAFNVMNSVIKWPLFNYYMDRCMLVLVPLDMLLSLVLSGVVSIKIYRQTTSSASNNHHHNRRPNGAEPGSRQTTNTITATVHPAIIKHNA